MQLRNLKLTFFKNYTGTSFDFGARINCITGKNGMGKTNLLDAIHYLSMTKSALNTIDGQNIQKGAPYFALNSQFDGDSELLVNCYYDPSRKKVIKVNGEEVDKLSNHIGLLPSVLILPDDTAIIKEGSEIRRKFFDSVISQHDKDYLDNLIQMQRLLKQRNALLKQNEGRPALDKNLLAIYDAALMPLFTQIATRRSVFLERFLPHFHHHYQCIFDGDEAPVISYRSTVLKDGFASAYQQATEKDIILQRTTCGAHRDDYVFQLNGDALRKFASQGQQKSFIIALKLGEYDYLREQKGFQPILLLDDIFDKLDDERISRLVSLLTNSDRFGQVFITDARAERSRLYFDGQQDVRFFDIQNGQLHG